MLQRAGKLNVAGELDWRGGLRLLSIELIWLWVKTNGTILGVWCTILINEPYNMIPVEEIQLLECFSGHDPSLLGGLVPFETAPFPGV